MIELTINDSTNIFVNVFLDILFDYNAAIRNFQEEINSFLESKEEFKNYMIDNIKLDLRYISKSLNISFN